MDAVAPLAADLPLRGRGAFVLGREPLEQPSDIAQQLRELICPRPRDIVVARSNVLARPTGFKRADATYIRIPIEGAAAGLRAAGA